MFREFEETLAIENKWGDRTNTIYLPENSNSALGLTDRNESDP